MTSTSCAPAASWNPARRKNSGSPPGTPGPANSSPRPIPPSRQTVCLRTATPPHRPPHRRRHNRRRHHRTRHTAQKPREPAHRPGPRTSGACPHRPPRQDHRPAPHRSPPPAGLHGRRGPLGQRQDHPRPLPGRSPPDLRRGGPARRCRTAPQPARPYPRTTGGSPVRLPGRPVRLRRTPPGPRPGEPHCHPPAQGPTARGAGRRRAHPELPRVWPATSSAASPRNSPAANSSAPPWPAHCWPARGSCSATRSPPAWTPSPAGTSAPSSRTSCGPTLTCPWS